MAKLKVKGKKYILTLSRKEAKGLAAILDVVTVPADMSKLDYKIWEPLDRELDGDYPGLKVTRHNADIQLVHEEEPAPVAGPASSAWTYVSYEPPTVAGAADAASRQMRAYANALSSTGPYTWRWVS